MTRLEHPLVGIRRRPSRWALAGLGAILVAIVAQRFLPATLFDPATNLWLTPLWDGVSTLLIFSVALTYLAAIGYAAYNGGPVVALSIALLPTLLGAAVRGHLAVTVDLALALSAAAAACWVALARTRPPGDAATITIALGTAVTVVAAVSVVRAFDAVGSYARPGVVVASILLGLGVIVGSWAVRRFLYVEESLGVIRSS